MLPILVSYPSSVLFSTLPDSRTPLAAVQGVDSLLGIDHRNVHEIRMELIGFCFSYDPFRYRMRLSGWDCPISWTQPLLSAQPTEHGADALSEHEC